MKLIGRGKSLRVLGRNEAIKILLEKANVTTATNGTAKTLWQAIGASQSAVSREVVPGN